MILMASLLSISTLAELPNYKCFLRGKEVLNFTFESELNVDSPRFAKKEVEKILRDNNQACQVLDVLNLKRASYEEVEVSFSCGNDGMGTFAVSETLNCVETYLN